MQLHKRNKIYLLTAGYFHISMLQATFLHPPRQPCLRCFHELIYFILVMDYNACQSLGTLAMIYAIGALQNPLPRKTMLCKGDMNNSIKVNTVVE